MSRFSGSLSVGHTKPTAIVTMVPAHFPAFASVIDAPGDIAVFCRGFRSGITLGRACSLFGRDTYVSNDLDSLFQLISDVPPRFAVAVFACIDSSEAKAAHDAHSYYDLSALGIRHILLDATTLPADRCSSHIFGRGDYASSDYKLAGSLSGLLRAATLARESIRRSD